MTVETIVVAGGSGKRMGGAIRKQFMLLNGVPIIVHTLRALISLDLTDRFVVVAPPHACESTRELLEAHIDFKDLVVVAGGDERQYSVRCGLAAVSGTAEIILVHDAVRPLFDAASTEAVVQAAREHGAATVAIRVQETVKRVTEGFVLETLPRDQLWTVQTPQAFRQDVLRSAHEAAMVEGFLGTDDASLVERVGGTVRIVEGTAANIKVTTPYDLRIAQALLKAGDD